MQQCGTDCSRESRETHAADVMNGRRREVQKLPAGSLDPVKASLEARTRSTLVPSTGFGGSTPALHRILNIAQCASGLVCVHQAMP